MIIQPARLRTTERARWFYRACGNDFCDHYRHRVDGELSDIEQSIRENKGLRPSPGDAYEPNHTAIIHAYEH